MTHAVSIIAAEDEEVKFDFNSLQSAGNSPCFCDSSRWKGTRRKRTEFLYVFCTQGHVEKVQCEQGMAT